MSKKPAKLSAAQRALELKQQLFTEELIITDTLLQSLAAAAAADDDDDDDNDDDDKDDAPLRLSDVDVINRVTAF